MTCQTAGAQAVFYRPDSPVDSRIFTLSRSFLNVGEFCEREVEPLARELREGVRRWVGIPTCVGIVLTKTLAKVANFIARKRPQYRGVLRSAFQPGAG